jgi:hypothetical protein
MEFLGLLFSFFVTCISTNSILAEYHFGSTLGQIFVDYSGNGMSAVNGKTTAVEGGNDAITSDRGAYFSGGAHAITIPPNSVNTAGWALSPPFSMTMWVMTNCASASCALINRYTSGSSWIYIEKQTTNYCHIWAGKSNPGVTATGTSALLNDGNS